MTWRAAPAASALLRQAVVFRCPAAAVLPRPPCAAPVAAALFAAVNRSAAATGHMFSSLAVAVARSARTTPATTVVVATTTWPAGAAPAAYSTAAAGSRSAAPPLPARVLFAAARLPASSLATASAGAAAPSSTHSASPSPAAAASAASIPAAASAASFSTSSGSAGSASPAEAAATAATSRAVGYWFLGCGALVFLIVAVGGLTRLTESGLSIVEWNLIAGMKPPRSQEEWEAEFEKYKLFPEYKLLNHNMTLAEFKNIFYYEWAHRMLGRLIGLAVIVPGAYFALRGRMSPGIQRRALFCALMVGGQGVLGWYMVRSGLKEELMQAKSFHGVSQYWLTAHLGSAFVIYVFMLFSGLEILQKTSKNNVKTVELLRSMMQNPAFRRFRMFVHIVTSAFVAGLDAGLIYNEFPFMGDGIVPSDMWALSRKSATITDPIPLWRNLFENPAAVQFNHRLL
ncbi:Cytochrome c oxidase assembly protein cox15, partial [Cladochytrium tenue]